MQRYLNKDEYLHLAPEREGIVRVNHASPLCGGDSKSMLVERKENGDVAAHCFRCGSGGFVPSQPFYRRPSETSGREHDSFDGSVAIGGLVLPRDVGNTVLEWPSAPRDWLARARLSIEDIEREGFLWSRERDALYIPVRQSDDLAGFVIRKFSGEKHERYKTLTLDKSRFFGYYPNGELPTASIVIVEDTLSALRVRRYSDSLALLTTSIKPPAIELLLRKGYDSAVIYLDADNSIVQREARAIARRLPFTKVRIIETGRDPKAETDDKLKQLLEG